MLVDPTTALPPDDEVWHFSEDPAIERFVPHVAATARQDGAYVWAVDAEHAPSYWFPRQCPRAMAWIGEGTTDEDAARIAPVARLHLIEPAWLAALQTTQVYAYRFARSGFRPFRPDERHAWVAEVEVQPLGPPVALPNLLDLQLWFGVELGVEDSVRTWWEASRLWETTLLASGIRLANSGKVPADFA